MHTRVFILTKVVLFFVLSKSELGLSCLKRNLLEISSLIYTVSVWTGRKRVVGDNDANTCVRFPIGTYQMEQVNSEPDVILSKHSEKDRH